ncbi:hypothetical protein Vadar_020808 [Vaccinium darrowii]|nr:hypothetical protein Vadar_020808 [Vaccinium darrowii]
MHPSLRQYVLGQDYFFLSAVLGQDLLWSFLIVFFSQLKFAFLSLGHPDYLQDSDIVSNRFQRRDVYGAWEQYLGLEHSGKVRFLSCWVNDASEEALELAAVSIEFFEREGLDLRWLKERLGEAKTVKKYSELVNTVDSCGNALEVARGDLQVARCAFEVALAKVRELEEGLANAKAEVEVMSSRELPKSVGVNDFVLKDIV